MTSYELVLAQLTSGPMTRRQLEEITHRELRNVLSHMREDGLIKIHAYENSPIKGRVTIYAIGAEVRKKAAKRVKVRAESWVDTWAPFRDPMYTAIFGKTK
jgi:DNA-binding HxlR family transcriptional regulator